jgi:hypothetical protein
VGEQLRVLGYDDVAVFGELFYEPPDSRFCAGTIAKPSSYGYEEALLMLALLYPVKRELASIKSDRPVIQKTLGHLATFCSLGYLDM